MSSHQEWCQSQIAPTESALSAGDGCHRDEAKALSNYLNIPIGTVEAVSNAAKQITTPITSSANPPSETYRLWALLATAMVELDTSTHLVKLLRLLSAIQSLPSPSSNPDLDWKTLPGFLNMWSDLHRLHFHGPDAWETESLSDQRKTELREHFRSVGRAEAAMWAHDIAGVPAEWGYDVMDLAVPARAGVDVLLSEVHAWLEVAGPWMKMRFSGLSEIESRCDDGTRCQHWERWKEILLQLSGDESQLSAEGRALARECYDMML